MALAEKLRAAGIVNVTANALQPASLMRTKMVFESFGRNRLRQLSEQRCGVDYASVLASAPAAR